MPLVHLIAVVLCYARYGQVHWMFETPSVSQFPVAFPPGWGFSLSIVYLVWVGVVVALYPLCCWFAAVKRRRSDPWLGYL
jgi:formate hydrogenlyase subunit 3/multisubunit Na+/H+ antiporter MnhD subunit